MKISVILGHPAPGSFNHAIADTAVKRLTALGHEVHYHDLYAEEFDPVYTAGELKKEPQLPAYLELHCREMDQAHGLIVIHPNYWSRPPAIICGWVDRVLRAGRAYTFIPDGKGGARAVSLMRTKVALVFNTANTPQAQEEVLFGDPLEVHWRKVVFGLCGIPTVYRRNFSSVITSTPAQREQWLDEVRMAADKYFPKS